MQFWSDDDLARRRPPLREKLMQCSDGGETWAEAEFLDPVRRHAWRRWKFDWLTPKEPGQHTLPARAKDASGRVQPDKHDPNYGSYVIIILSQLKYSSRSRDARDPEAGDTLR
jgi:hypothetical protein